MPPSAAYIISISGKNVPERGMCPWAVLYYRWFHLSCLISLPAPHLNSSRMETTPSAILQFPEDQGQNWAKSRPFENAC